MAFRQAMGLFATGVGIVSVAKPDGAPSGITANSIVSVSLEPMLVSWSIQNGSSLFDLYAGAERFAISILNVDQRELALRYAARGDTQTQTDDFELSERGHPVIAGAVGTIECPSTSLPRISGRLSRIWFIMQTELAPDLIAVRIKAISVSSATTTTITCG